MANAISRRDPGALGFTRSPSARAEAAPRRGGPAFDLNPGSIFKQEVKGLCRPGTDAAPQAGLTKLSLFAQAYLMDRMESIASEQQDKALKIPGKRLESPSVPLGFIGLPGTGTAVIWYDPDKQGVDKLNGVLLKLTFKSSRRAQRLESCDVDRDALRIRRAERPTAPARGGFLPRQPCSCPGSMTRPCSRSASAHRVMR